MSELSDKELGDLRDCNPANPFIAPIATELLALRERVKNPVVKTGDLLKALERAGDDNDALRERVTKLEAALKEARSHIHGDCWVRSEVQRKIDAVLKDAPSGTHDANAANA